MAKDPNASAQRWAQNLAGSTTAITEGVNGVTVAPGQAAVKQKAVWVQNTTAAADKWGRNTSAVSLAAWQQDMIQKGIPRIAQGAQAAMPKMAAFLTAFIPFVNQGVAALPPRGTLQQNIARMVAMVNHNAQFTYRRPGQ